MKKTLLIFLMMAMTFGVLAQSQLNTIRGKTKDGKTIKIDYYKGSVEDYVESVKYQVVDELQSKVNDLQKEVVKANKSVEDQKKTMAELNRRITELEQGRSDSSDTESFKKQVAAKEAEIQSLNGRIAILNEEIKKTNERIAVLNVQDAEQLKDGKASSELDGSLLLSENKALRDTLSNKEETIRRLNTSLTEADQRIEQLGKECERQIALAKETSRMSKPARAPVIGLSYAVGPAFVRSTDLDEIWTKAIRTGNVFQLYYGTPRLAENFSVLVEMGAGIRRFEAGIHFNACQKTFENQTDADGQTYTALYAFSDMQEVLSLTYFDIPVCVCLGQPAKDRIAAYLSLGLTTSIKVSSKFEGEGAYSLRGYYPQWDVTLENISELGFANDVKAYDGVHPEFKSINLWANVAFGAYVPFGCLTVKPHPSNVVLKAGLKGDMSLKSLSSTKKTSSDKALVPGKSSLPSGDPKVFLPMVEIGLVYILK